MNGNHQNPTMHDHPQPAFCNAFCCNHSPENCCFTPPATIFCFGVQQMQHLLSQLADRYPDQEFQLVLQSGSTLVGRLTGELPDANPSLLTVKTGLGDAVTVPICAIAAVAVTGEGAYDTTITYLPAPCLMLPGCDAACDTAVRSYLPEGTTGVSVGLAGRTLATGTVVANQPGILVVAGDNGVRPVFISAGKVETMTKSKEPK